MNEITTEPQFGVEQTVINLELSTDQTCIIDITLFIECIKSPEPNEHLHLHSLHVCSCVVLRLVIPPARL